MARTKSKPKAKAGQKSAPPPKGIKRKHITEADPDVDEAELPPPSKRRKAAETSLAKLKAIAEAEGDLSDHDEDDSEGIPDEAKAPEINVKNLSAQEVLEGEGARVVAPGFRLWETDSKLLARRGETLRVTKVDKARQDYSRILEVHYSEVFSLVPLVVTQGPYKGRHLFMLEPESGFRLMDLPPEIRLMIFEYLLEEEKSISMITAKRTDEGRRSVRAGWNSPSRHQGLKFDHKAHLWIDKPPSPYAILRVSKQVLRETASIAYGNNKFSFPKITDLKYFLEHIGSMRRFLRHIFIDRLGYQNTRARQAFKMLKDATDLRTLSLDHSNVCQDGYGYRASSTAGWVFSIHIEDTLRVLHADRKGDADAQSVLDIIKVHWEKCTRCKQTAPAFPPDDSLCVYTPGSIWRRSGICTKPCKDHTEHCTAIEKKVRKLIATRLGIKFEDEEEKANEKEKVVDPMLAPEAASDVSGDMYPYDSEDGYDSAGSY